MRRLPNSMMRHGGQVVVEALLGYGVDGPAFADPVTPERAAIQGSSDLMTSESIVTVRVWLDPEHVVPVGSRVRVWVGSPREAECIVKKSVLHDHPPLPTHVELQAG